MCSTTSRSAAAPLVAKRIVPPASGALRVRTDHTTQTLPGLPAKRLCRGAANCTTFAPDCKPARLRPTASGIHSIPFNISGAEVQEIACISCAPLSVRRCLNTTAKGTCAQSIDQSIKLPISRLAYTPNRYCRFKFVAYSCAVCRDVDLLLPAGII